jgi:hypothetical protein
MVKAVPTGPEAGEGVLTVSALADGAASTRYEATVIMAVASNSGSRRLPFTPMIPAINVRRTKKADAARPCDDDA